MEKRKFLRLRLKIRLSCSDLHYIFHILNSIGGPLGPMVQTSPSAQSDRSRTIKKIIKPVWTNGPLDRSGPVVLSLGADHRAPCSLDTPESLNQVSRAFSTLQAVAVVFDSHLTREATQNATMLIRLSQNRKERDVKTLRDALSRVHGTNENGLTGSEPLGRYVVLEPERVVNDGFNGSKAGQQQPMGDGLAEASNFVPDLNGLGTGDTDGLINPDNLAMDWDALLGNPDLLDWI